MNTRTLLCLVVMVVGIWCLPASAVSPSPAGRAGKWQFANGSNPAADPAPLLIMTEKDVVKVGTTFRLTFYIGTATAPVSNLFGLAFELHYTNGEHIWPVAPARAEPGPFLQPETYDFALAEPERGMISLAVSRKRGNAGRSGHGEVLSVQFEVSEDAPSNTEFCFSVMNITADDSVGGTVNVVPGDPLCLRVEDLSVKVVPNPFTPNDDGSNDRVEFRRVGGIPPEWTISILDRYARVIKRLSNSENTWDGTDDNQREMLPGVYLYMVQDGQEILDRGVIGLVR